MKISCHVLTVEVSTPQVIKISPSNPTIMTQLCILMKTSLICFNNQLQLKLIKKFLIFWFWFKNVEEKLVLNLGNFGFI